MLWAPVAFGAGAALYLGAPGEPPAGLIPVFWALAALCFAGAILARGRPFALYAVALTGLVACGFAHVETRARALAETMVAPPERAVEVTGWIEEVRRSGGRERLVIQVSALEGYDDPPKRVRVRTDLGEFRPGDAVTLLARLDAAPGPAAPGGYDPARAAFFRSIALTGFAFTSPQPAEVAGAEWRRAFLGWRWEMARRFEAGAGERAGGVAAALLTGDRSGVSEADAEALRISGLGHILAISGLHMALLAGAIYWCARLAFAAIDHFARAHDPRKPAALIALAAAAFYLALSGASVSTQRAFVMTAVVLIGVMLDRRALSIRSLAIAALIVLGLRPESVAEAGFQMSFAATAALISAYEALRLRFPPDPDARGPITNLRKAAFGLAATSVIAGAATGAFAAFHFQRMAAYGLVANLTAMPVFTFWVMPAGVASLAASFFGLETVFLAVMEPGLRVVLAIAHWTASLPGAGAHTIAPANTVVALYGLGFALLVIGKGAARSAGAAMALAAMLAWAGTKPPDLMLTTDGVVLARFEAMDGEAGDTAYAATDLRRSRYERDVLLQRAGAGEGGAGRAPLRCDAMGCTAVTADGLTLAVTDRHEAMAQDCEQVDIVVFRGRASAWMKRRCAALLFDNADRASLGGAQFWVRDGEVVRLTGALNQGPDRLWSRRE